LLRKDQEAGRPDPQDSLHAGLGRGLEAQSIIRDFHERLKANSKRQSHSLRKLFHIAFGVLKSGKPFD
jgi:hypothetical protein